MGTQQITELALVDTGADINAISYETWEHMGKPPMNQSGISVETMSGQTNLVEGGLDLEVFIGATNVCERFFVMKPGMMETSVILGQPWQRRYNGVPNWRQEGINFETSEAKFFTPFYDDSISVSKHSSDINSIKESHKEDSLIEPIALPFRLRPKKQGR